MNNNIPPFYVGQRVVAISSHGDGLFKKGEEFSVTGIKKACCCWVVSVGIVDDMVDGICVDCNIDVKAINGQFPFYSGYFRAITDDFQPISYERVIEEELVSMN